MAITQYSDKRIWTCLSTETQPTTGVRNGDKLVEINPSTNVVKKYVFDKVNETWNEDISNLDSASLGQLGGKYIATTDATAPDTGYAFTSIQVISDAVITLVGNITGITSVSVLAGTVIYGRYTSCTLASGSVIAYQGV